MKESACDILIVGGGTGGCAAALAATSLGHRVILTEETDWLGGQLTAQAVPPDEHPWIESFGCTARYRSFRDGVRQFYRDHYPLTAEARANERLNPGGGFVSRLCHEPRVALAVLEQMMAWPRASGRLDVRLKRKAVAAHLDATGDRVRAITLQNLETGDAEIVHARYVLDATELGDLLPLAGCEYVTGAEAQSETGEAHAPAEANPNDVQGFTWCFPAAFDPNVDDKDDRHVIERPREYDRWRSYVPTLAPAWTGGPLLDWAMIHPITLAFRPSVLFYSEQPDKNHIALFHYRQIVKREHFTDPNAAHDVTLVNWPQNDYWEGNVIDASEKDAARFYEESRQLSLSLLFWLQTEAPRPNGKTGYPGLHLRPDLVGTRDGLAKSAYIRESRRIRAVFTVTENHVGSEARPGEVIGEAFPDSVGVGCYRIDLHPSTGGVNYVDIGSLPFQIPLGALLPVRMENLLPACKNGGVTHVTNGCYRLHPVEWNIGEAAGLLAAFCLRGNVPPRQVREDPARLADFQNLLRAQGVELAWPALRPV